MKKETYLKPEALVIKLEPSQMLANSIKIEKDTEQGIDTPEEILTNKAEWEHRGNYWDDK